MSDVSDLLLLLLVSALANPLLQSKYWINFAGSLDPNGPDSNTTNDTLAWPSYDQQTKQSMQFKVGAMQLIPVSCAKFESKGG